MANLAIIQNITEGKFFTKDSLGNLVELKVGDKVSLNDTIVAANSNTDISKLEILFDTNELVVLSQGETLLDETLLASTFGNEELAFDKKELDETLSAWNNTDGNIDDMETAAGDVTEQATNAGNEEAEDGGALRSKFNSRDGDATDIVSDLRAAPFGGATTQEPQEQIPTELLNPVGTTTPTAPTAPTAPTIPVDTRVPASVITLSDPSVKEGNQITITATVTNAPQTDLIITLDNGQTITIPAGQTTGTSEPFTNPNSEDVYVDNSTETYKITDATGGNYVSLDTSDSSVVTIDDTINPTTVKLTSTSTEGLTEDGGDVTYKVDLGAVVRYGDNPVTVTFKDILGKEKTITINPPANESDEPVKTGEITVSYTEDELAREDVYKEAIENLGAKDAKVTGGNFEKLGEVSITNNVTLKDSEDTTTVTIKGNNVNEGGTATFEIQLSNPPQKGVPLETVIADFTGRNYKQNELINDGWKIEGDGSMAVGNHSGKDGKSERLLIRDQNDGNDNPTTVTSPTFKIVEGDSGKVSFNFYGQNYNSKDNSFTWKVEKLDTKTGKWEVVQEETISKSISSGGEQLVTTNSLGGGEYRVVYEVKTGEDNKHYKGTENEKSANYGVYIDNVKVTTEKTTGKVQVGDKTYDVVFDENGKATLKVPVKGNDHYIGEPTLTAKVIEVNGGNYEKVDLNTTGNNSEIIVKDTTNITKVTITAVETTEKVITKDNFANNAGFTVKAKDPYGKEAKISTHGNPSGFGVESEKETTSGKLGQTDQVYSGHTSEIGVVQDGDTYKSESIEVVFKNPIQTLDVAFAWRHNGERAKVDFYNEDTKVGYAIVKGGGSDTQATIEYYDKNGILKESVQAQGGTDKVDLVYTFKPAGDVTFTKAVFSADGAGSDYLIHSIAYKEVIDGDSTTIVGSNEVAFEIKTSVKPDPSKFDFKTTFPTADVKIVDNTGKEVFKGTVNLDKNGNAIVTVRTDGTVDLEAKVSNVQGNFEAVDYKNATTTIEGFLVPKASNDNISTLEDTQYTLKSTDFGDKNQNIAQVQFNEVPENGTIYVLKSEYTGSMNDRAEYTSSENKVYIGVKAGDIVDISKINSGSVVFVPKENSDKNGSFNFSVSNGKGNFSGNYTTTIDVKAVADAPTVSIDVTKTEISQGDELKGNDKILNHGSKKTIDFEGVSNKVSINVDLNGNGNTSGKINFYSNGVLISSQSLINGKHEYELEAGKYFDKFELEHTGNSNGSNNGAIHLNKWSLEAESNKYAIEYSAKLTDTDRSEKLSDFIIKNLPEGSKLFGVDKQEIKANSDGSYTVIVDENGKAKLTLESQDKLSEDELNSIKASATSTENSNGDTATSTVDNILGTDINLDNLSSIISENGEINLANNKAENINLTLDDVLKISGEDNTIKISGDKFDSVTFKNTIGENGQAQTWSKAENSIVEDGKTFEVYTNSGDESLKVKVEQPISDGITN